MCVCVCLCVSSFFFPRIHADSFAFFSLPSRLFSFVCVCLSVGVRVHLELVVFVVFLSFLCFFSLPVGFVSLFLSSCLSVSVVSFVFFLTGLHSLRVCLSWLLLLAPSNHSIMRRSSMQQNKNTFCLADSSPETHFLRLYLVLLGFTAFQYDTCSIDFSGLDSSFT